MATVNVSNLPRLAIGMNEAEVLKIMHHPYSQETHTIQCDTYDVWFYVTRTTALGQSRMVPLNLTPLTFKNGRLIGWGYDHYHHIFHLHKKQKAPPKKHKRENIKLEKALENKTSMSKPPSQKEEPAVDLDEQDEKMIEEADEQNFDYW